MSDPIEDAFKSLHQGNLLAAKDARIRQLEGLVEQMHNNIISGISVNAECRRLKEEVDMWKLRSDNWQKLCQIAKEGQANG
jgi:hypothetical protein